MNPLRRIRGVYDNADRFGKVLLLISTSLFAFVVLAVLASFASGSPEPDDPAPVRAATIPVLADTAEPPTDTPRPSATLEPSPSPAPTDTATLRPSPTPRPSSTPRPPTPTPLPPTATPRPSTATSAPPTAVPPTATPVRVATIPLPTATLPPPPPPPPPTATFPPPAPTSPPPPAGNCDPAYPTVCIPPPPPDLDCGDIPYRRFQVLPPDPHRFDGDGNGIGCESG